MADELKQQRANTRKSISRIKTIVEANGRGEGRPLSPTELKCRLGILESYFKQLLSFQSQIEKLEPDDNSRGELEDLYVSIKISIQEQLGEDLNSTFKEQTFSNCSSSSRLPILKLPAFSGRYAEYKNFITSFNQIIDRELGLSNIEKFNHLLNCLHGQALETVKAFQVSNENYPKALDRLKSRYDNNTLIFMENIASLFEMPATTKPSCYQLRSLVDNVSALYSSLLSLGSNKDISNAMLIYMVMQKVDDGTQKKWKESLDFTSLPTWDSCAKVLERRCQYLESIDISHTQSDCTRRAENRNTKKPDKRQNYSFACTNRSCVLCTSAEHAISSCQKFNNMPVSERFECVKRLQLCINCLSKHHKVTQCSSAFKCKFCSRSHHSSLHRTQATTASPAATSAPPSSPSPSSTSAQSRSFLAASSSTNQRHLKETSATVHTHLDSTSQDAVILATAIVLVRDVTGAYQLGRALLDSCSQVNFMTEAFSQKLRLPREGHNITIVSIGESSTRIKHKTSTNIKSRFNNFELPLNFCVTSHISYQPDAEIDISSWNLPANTALADEQFFQSKRIDLLLGTESFFDVLSVGQIKLGENLPTLQKTLLGWVVSGKYNTSSPISPCSSTCLLSCEKINYNLEQLWKLEEVVSKTTLSEEQASCEAHFVNNVRRDSSGRIVVRLPFKESSASLGYSRDVALRRFFGLERRLVRIPDIKNQYVAFINEYEKLGHMSLVKNPSLTTDHFYIPHHFVLKPNSTSTKLRVVFDASCRTSTQKSLNDILMVGATIQNDLFTLLLQFRLFRYVVTADIIKMYRQVRVDPQDCRFQYILWRNCKNEEIQTYQLDTVTYGTAAAPFLAVRSLHYLADQYAEEFALGSKMIKSSFYVDDFLCGADTLEELTNIKFEVTSILQKGGLELAKWHSNVESFVDDETIKNLNFDDTFVTNALGITWDQKQDSFLFSFAPKNHYNGKISKRTILSLASSLFDPLGVLAPLLVTAKIILQELWLLKLDWDESVPQCLHLAWENLLKELSALSLIAVPRYCLRTSAPHTQLHGFCDASIRAYGCCVYVRSENEVRLLTAKSRVAPTKKKSLPKLELCGAQLLAKLIAKIRNILCHLNLDIFLWCDSQIVLHWLQTHSSTLSTFVGNRVSEIQDLTADCQWRYVPTQCNPADIVSRGCTIRDLVDSIWFTGPSFLLLSQDHWPENVHSSPNMDEVNKEKRKATFFGAEKSNHVYDMLLKFSSYLTTIRVVAWMLRFYKKINKSHHQQSIDATCPLSADEFEIALWCIVRIIQQEHFEEDILKAQKGLPAHSALKHLNPFLEDNCGYNLLKVGGRLELATMPDWQKHPVLLPRKCHFVECLVRHLHISNYHAGPKALVALIRLRFWIVNARDVARRTVRGCIHCMRYRPKLLRQVMGNLPIERLTPCRPFSRCAVDFCGPVNTFLRIRGKTPYKTYIAIFVCLWSKAVHIEIVSDLSTPAFIASLKRLIGRRGLPADIFCDNATNFVGANRKLTELKEFIFNSKTKNEIINFCSNDFINFHFIPPRAPHFGGLWEAAVKSAKGHLNRTLANARLTYEELTTALVEVEAILNSRPLSPLSSDPSDFEALTPAHFIIGSSLKAIPEHAATTNAEIHHLERWARISAVKQRFWQQWSHEYLSELHSRTKWVRDQPNVNVDALVIIHDDNVPPQRWITGRIVDVIPGKDGKVRVADVRTPKGIIRRPIHKLALLPV